MVLKCNGSGSSGNGYALISDEGVLLIECGVPAKEMLKSIDYKTSKVVGCLSSHGHGDHSKYISDYMRYGIQTYGSDEVSKDIEEIYGEKVTGLQRMKQAMIGGFSVVPFAVPHGDTECDGYLIMHEEIGSLLFITDAEYNPYDFSNIKINHLMVECNYSEDYLTKDAENYGHVIRGHMELQTCKRLIHTVNSTSLRSVGLLHLSGGNSDAVRFSREIKELIDPDVNAWVEEKGFQMELSLDPF